MADTVMMPKLGFDMAEGTLVRWVAAEGEAVKKGSVLAEIETDKATVEVESSYEGTVLRHLITEGVVVPVGDPIAVIGKPGEAVETPAAAKPAAAEQEKPAPAQAPAESPAATVQPPAGSPAPSTQPPAENPAAAAQPPAESPAPALQTPAQTPTATQAAVEQGHLPEGLRASPIARRIAEERGINLAQVRGSGPGGRVVKKDLEVAMPVTAAPQPAPTSVPAAAASSLPPVKAWRTDGQPATDQSIPLTKLRLAVGRRMVQAKQTVPHFYVTHEYDVARMVELRAQLNALLPEGEKLSVNDFITKAVALTLLQFPNLNATLDGDKVIRRGQVNVGSAVAVEGGLLTVVCRDTDQKPIRLISTEIRQMAERVRSGKIRPDDIEGSTFSISNLGMFDVENFIAIINPPEAAILAVGSARQVPVIEDGQVKAGMRMKATISVDHRVSDGAEAARFMQALAGFLEEPMKLLL